jgi:RNA ligase (TIGR02306 family)
MSTTIITIEEVNTVSHHPNADKLDVIKVLGYDVVVGRDQYKVGDQVVYFPPDILIPPEVACELGVIKYLKHAVYPGDNEKTQCRVGATRLRGVSSYGFVITNALSFQIGTDVTDMYSGQKYIPPVRVGAGDALPELENFPKYTNIQNYQRYPDAISVDTDVVVTEKIHGTNCRLGLVRVGDEFQFVAGSHNQRRSEGADENISLYWYFMQDCMDLLTFLCDEQNDAIIYGEIFGQGVQDLDYGQIEKSFRVFDISLNGRYLNYWDMVQLCDGHEVLTVPLLYIGPFTRNKIKEITDGETTFSGVRSKFKGREGVVVRPVKETFSEVLGGRMIVKSISADYSDRKGAIDNE